MFEDLDPVPKAELKRNLTEMSIGALHDYIRELEDEIRRARNAVHEKESARHSADSVFGS